MLTPLFISHPIPPLAIYVLYGWIQAQGLWHHIRRAGIAHRKDTAPAFMTHTARHHHHSLWGIQQKSDKFHIAMHCWFQNIFGTWVHGLGVYALRPVSFDTWLCMWCVVYVTRDMVCGILYGLLRDMVCVSHCSSSYSVVCGGGGNTLTVWW